MKRGFVTMFWGFTVIIGVYPYPLMYVNIVIIIIININIYISDNVTKPPYRQVCHDKNI